MRSKNENLKWDSGHEQKENIYSYKEYNHFKMKNVINNQEIYLWADIKKNYLKNVSQFSNDLLKLSQSLNFYLSKLIIYYFGIIKIAY